MPRFARLLAAALVPALASCDGAATSTRAPEGMRAFALVPEAADAEFPCGTPVSGRVELEDGRWRMESHWDPACAAEGVTSYVSSGTFTLRGDTIQLAIPNEEEGGDAEVEMGLLSGDTLVVWGHCDVGDAVYVRR